MSKELMVGFLTKAYNKTEDEINALIFNGDEIKENALQSLIDLDALKVRKFKDETTKAFDNGINVGAYYTDTDISKANGAANWTYAGKNIGDSTGTVFVQKTF